MPSHKLRIVVEGRRDALAVAQRFRSTAPMMLLEGIKIDQRSCDVLGIGATCVFRASGQEARAEDESQRAIDLPDGIDPLARLCRMIEASCDDDHAGLEGRVLRSWLGFMAYDAVRQFEALPRPATANPTPDYIFFRPAIWVIFDTESNRIVIAGDPDRADTVHELASWLRSVKDGPLPDLDDAAGPRATVQATQSMQEFCDRVERAKEYILDGDIFQVVLSLRHDVPCDLDPLALYARLRAKEPLALRYCFLDRTLAIVGASPEPLINAEDGMASIRSLAGTALRGATADEDREREAGLRSSHKDLAEHRMLVDLARNDLGRIAVPGSVRVTELMQVEYYSRVMHLASETVAELDRDGGIDRVIRSTFPAGTMTGTPKVRAMEIIDELEPVRRGIYSGAFGLISPDWLRMYLAIRTMVVSEGVARVQAGAGIVSDSSPTEEYAECLSKMKACLAALGVQQEAMP